MKLKLRFLNVIFLVYITFCASTLLLSQTTVKVRITPGKLATVTEMLIPDGEKIIYERYFYFKHHYWLEIQDTLLDVNSPLKVNKKTISFENFNSEYDLCDSFINKIRNSGIAQINDKEIDSLEKQKIGIDNNEMLEYKRSIYITDSILKSTCPDEFITIINNWNNKVLVKIEEIFNKKELRLQWIASNHNNLDANYIKNFLKTFDSNNTDKRAFLEIIIGNTKDLILEIDKQTYPYLIYSKLYELPKSDKLLFAFEILKKSSIKGKTFRKIKKRLKTNLK